MIRPPPISPLFPYAPFSRSRRAARPVRAVPGNARLAPRRYLDGHLTGPHDALCAERPAVPPGEVAQHPGGGGASAPVVGLLGPRARVRRAPARSERPEVTPYSRK